MKKHIFEKTPYLSLAFNILYAFANSLLGIIVHSWWFITVGAYYTVLAVMRFSALRVRHKANGDLSKESCVMRKSGVLLIFLSICIAGVNTLTFFQVHVVSFHKIIMIAIATYSFMKITLAIIGMVQSTNISSPVVKTLRNISLADACVSIYSTQRAMLATFPGMAAANIRLLNFITGTVVLIIVLFLGIHLVVKKATHEKVA